MMEAATAPKTTAGPSNGTAAVVKPRNTEYHVFKVDGERNFTHLTAKGAVKASSRKEAISKASAAPGLPTAEGGAMERFLVIAAKELQIITRKVETKVEEVFE